MLESPTPNSPKPVTLSPESVRILSDGIRNQSDLAHAFELLKAIEPHDGGILVSKAIELGVRFEFQSPGDLEDLANIRASTTLTNNRLDSRWADEVGETITFYLSNQGEKLLGADLSSLKHELIHAIPLQHLPTHYRESLPEQVMPEMHNINSIYQSVLQSMYVDEAIAFMSGFLLEANAKAAGIELSNYNGQKDAAKNLAVLRAAAGSDDPTFEQLYTSVQNQWTYCDVYRLMALSRAATRRYGDNTISSTLASVIDKLCEVKEIAGEQRRVVTPAKAYEFVTKDLLSCVSEIGINGTLTLAALLPKFVEVGKKLLSQDPNDLKEFFCKDLDILICEVARELGDEVVPIESFPLAKGGDLVLHPRQVISNEQIEHFSQETLADKIEIFGKYAEVLFKVSQTKPELIVQQLDQFLTFAERCEPISGANVYAMLLGLSEKSDLFNADQRTQLAISLLRSGYDEHGIKILKSEIENLELKENYKELFIDQTQLQYLFESGRSQLVLRYLERIVEVSDETMTQFDAWIESTSAESPEHEYGNVFLWKRLMTLGNALSLQHSEIIPPEIKQFLFNQHARLWNQIERWVKGKIDRYHREIAGGDAYGSIDELTSRNFQRGGGYLVDDQKKLLGVPKGFSWVSPDATQAIEDTLTSVLLFETGVNLLERFPESTHRLYLLRYAVEHLPDSASEVIREKLSRMLEGSLAAVEPAYRIWGFLDYPFVAQSRRAELLERTSRVIDYNKTPPFIITKVAQAMLAARSGDDPKNILSLLSEISKSETSLCVRAPLDSYSLHFEGIGQQYTIPFLVSAYFQVKVATQLPMAARHLLMVDALKKIDRPLIPVDGYDLLQCKVLGAVYRHAALAALPELKKQCLDLLRRHGLSLKESGEGYESEFQRSPVLPEKIKRLQGFVEIVESILEGAQSFSKMVSRITNDVEMKRGLFTTPLLVDVLEYLGTLLSQGNIALAGEDIQRFADTTIASYIISTGSSERATELQDEWFSIVKALKTIPMAETMRDEIFESFVKRASPRHMVKGERDSSTARVLFDGLKGIEFILGNKDLPRAEAALLHELRVLVTNLDYNRYDNKTAVVLPMLEWAVKKLVTDSALALEPPEELLQLRNTDTYRAAVESLFVFSNQGRQQLNNEEVDGLIRRAIQLEDSKGIIDLAEQLHLYFERITSEVFDAKREDGRLNYLKRDEFKDTLLPVVFTALEQAYQVGNLTFADAIVSTLTSGGSLNELIGKFDFYVELLDKPYVPLIHKRLIFQEISKSGHISRYATKLREVFEESGSAGREEALMRLALPSYGGSGFSPQIDRFLALVEDIEIGQLPMLVEAYRGMREGGWEGFQLDLFNEFSIECYANHVWDGANDSEWQKAIRQFGEISCIIQDLNNIRDFHAISSENYSRVMNNKYGGLIRSKDYLGDFYLSSNGSRDRDDFHYYDHRTILMYLERANLPHQLNKIPFHQSSEIFSNLRKCFARRQRLNDRVNARLFETPEIFRDQPEIVKFLATRYLLRLSAGERQDLLLAMEGVEPSEALLRFFEKAHLEKIGQFLSVWPQVSFEIRDQLARLQMKVLPSDRAEIVDTICRELPNHIAEVVVENLSDEAVASGTIGDVYRSVLPHGQEIAVKIISPSKEQSVRRGLSLLNEVRNLVASYGDEVKHGNEIIQFADMYSAMVLEELNLELEADRHNEILELYADDFGVPQCYWEYSTSRVLLTEWLPDIVPLTSSEVPAKIALKSAIKIKDHYIRTQIGEHGWCLTDHHPGNVVYSKKDNKTYVLDYGQVVFLEPKARSWMRQFGLAAMTKNAKTVVNLLESVSTRSDAYTTDSKGTLVGSIRTVLKTPSDLKNGFSFQLSVIIQEAGRSGLILDPDVLRVVKGLATVEGLVSEVTRAHGAYR